MGVGEKIRRRPVLEPGDRLSEILFGLIMVLTFTGSLSVATAERADVREMLIAALGCNLAWGVIDAVMYLMGCLHQRGVDIGTIMAVRRANSARHAHAIIRRNIPGPVADELHHELLERIRSRIMAMQLDSTRPRIHAQDLRGAVGVFLVVVAATAPVILPFLFVKDVALAMRLSNAVAVVMLALIGFAYGRVSGLSPLWTAASMVLLGVVLVGITIALGG